MREGRKQSVSLSGIATIIIFIAVIVVAVLWSINTNDLIWLPAPAEAIDTHISVQDHPLQPHRGTLYITFVEEQHANALTDFWYRHFDSDASIYSEQQIYGPSPPSDAQQQQENTAMMVDSKTEAEIAAFRALGYHPQIDPQVAISSFTSSSKASGPLQVNDVIVAANGHAIHTPDELRRVVHAVHPGASIALTIHRPTSTNYQSLHVSVPTVAISGTAALGVYLQLVGTPILPFKVTIDSQDIGGPSAGLMFTLAIINRLSTIDLTHGHKFAGTGTIDISGNVGSIGGAKQKVIGAHEAGAQYFFVPAACDANACNYQEAKPYAHGITLVPVHTLNDALTFLRHLK